MRVLFSCVAAYGHFHPLVPLARAFVDDGHEVAFATSASFGEHVRATGFDVLPVYAKNEAGLSESQIGLLFLVNTLVIVFTQLPTVRLVRGRRRMPTLGLFGLLWAGAWLLVPIAGSASPEAAFAILLVVMVVFAIGQCLHGAVAGPLAADLAEPRLLRDPASYGPAAAIDGDRRPATKP